MKVKDLKGNPKNPRKITEGKLEQLKKAFEEFGDLGGIVFNRETGHIISGHQRSKLLDPKSAITIEQKYKKPTATGTVAEGFVLLHGERIRYREVKWDEPKEKAATIAANKSAGEWDNDILSDWFVDLTSMGMDLSLTMFDQLEIDEIASDGVTKDKKGKKSRSASDEIKSVQLTFTDESHAEFLEHLGFFQRELQIDSVTDVILEVLRSGKAAYEE